MKTSIRFSILLILGLSLMMASCQFINCLTQSSDECNKKKPEYCCDDKLFTSIGLHEFDQYCKNYRDYVWSKTSPYYNTSSNLTYSIQATPGILTSGTSDDLLDFKYSTDHTTVPGLESISPNNYFDTRFMDIPIDELENYICAVKNSDLNNPGTDREINTLRFYYIRYNLMSTPSDYVPVIEEYLGKHSLAILPVALNRSAGVHEEFIEDDNGQTLIYGPPTTFNTVDAGSRSGGGNSSGGSGNSGLGAANHNELCPPLVGCDLPPTIDRIGG